MNEPTIAGAEVRIDEDLGRMTESQPPPSADRHETEGPTSLGRARPLWPWIVAIALVLAAAIAAWVLLGDGGAASDEAASETPLNFAEVVRTDLEEVTTLDGTLGRAEGETITSAVAGTVTAAAEPGTTVEPGGVLFEIDAAPVILMLGDSPAYRDLRISDETLDVIARSNGTVTRLVAEGSLIEQGDVIYEVDGEPVVALYGDVPAYRTMQDLSDNMTGDDVLQLETALVELGFDPGDLAVDGEFTDFTETMVEDWQEAIGAEEDGVVDLGEVVFIPGPAEVVSLEVSVGDPVTDGRIVLAVAGAENMDGADVQELEEGLSALGYDPGPVDGVFDASTKAAVVDWQAAVGLEADGIVNLGEVVFLSSAVRISGQATPVGAPVSPGGAVLEVTSSEIVVTAELPAADQEILEEDMTVTIELPDDRRVPGVVDEIESVAMRNAAGETVFEVKILLDDPSVAGSLDEAPVEVDVVTDFVQDVVAVPVTSLLALAEGGYAVELDLGDGQTRLVAVDPGFFADGLVEITADGIEPGDRVVVP